MHKIFGFFKGKKRWGKESGKTDNMESAGVAPGVKDPSVRWSFDENFFPFGVTVVPSLHGPCL